MSTTQTNCKFTDTTCDLCPSFGCYYALEEMDDEVFDDDHRLCDCDKFQQQELRRATPMTPTELPWPAALRQAQERIKVLEAELKKCNDLKWASYQDGLYLASLLMGIHNVLSAAGFPGPEDETYATSTPGRVIQVCDENEQLRGDVRDLLELIENEAHADFGCNGNIAPDGTDEGQVLTGKLIQRCYSHVEARRALRGPQGEGG